MKLDPRKHPHPEIHAAHQAHEDTLSPIERIGVWASDNMATWQCLTGFTMIGAACLIGALFGITWITFFFGALSSYFIQLVSLSILGIGQKVEAQRNAHVMAGIITDIKDIKAKICV